VIGLGAQDDVDQAKDFVAKFGTTFRMLWDPSFESWANLGVSLQPSVLIVSPDGVLLGRWLGVPSEDDLLTAARQSTTAADETLGQDRFCRYVDRYEQAHAVLASVDTLDREDLPRVYDDVRFGANAMAQTAPPDAAEAMRSFSESVVAFAAVAVDADFDLAAARAAGYDERLSDVESAARNIAKPIDEACGTSFDVGN
jgi:hypothetical protein